MLERMSAKVVIHNVSEGTAEYRPINLTRYRPSLTVENQTWAYVYWVLVCVLGTLIGLSFASCKYWRDQYQKPENKRRRKEKADIEIRAKEEKAVASVVQEPIPTSKFLSILRQKKSDKRLNIEVRAIVRNQEDFPYTVAQETHNALMNVKQEVVTYDHSRVILWDVPKGWKNDYINASHIDGYCVSKEYIASQGPNSRSIIQFWHMIWQEGVHCIVMTTGLFENAAQQCDKYWDDFLGVKKYVRHGNIHIWTEESIYMAQLNIRTFRIQKEGTCQSRIIRQFEMIGFHDNECADPGFILDVRRRVNNFISTSCGPILVHCRCGGGRTAVFIAVDFCLKQVEAEERVDIYGAVLHLRRYRKNMVRTLGQYRLIYDTVAMFLQCNYTVFSVAELQSNYPITSLRCQQIEQEFMALQYIVPALSIGDCASGHRVENRCKSRDIMMLPPERARPYLTSADTGDSGNDFINAVYIDGYFHVNSSLVTQWPKKSTLNDLWRLLFDFKINSLVVLNDIKFSRRYQRFWPKELDEEIKYGPISVKYLGCGKYPQLIIRAFAIHKNLANSQREPKYKDLIVKMFQVTNGTSPAKISLSHKSLLYVMQCVDDWQQKTNPTTPVCIMSKDGSSRCGIYAAVNICVNQVEIDGECDIFNAVRLIKRNRPHLVSTIDEYRYIYNFMEDYVNRTTLQPQIVITGITGNATNYRTHRNAVEDISPVEDSNISARSSRSGSFATAIDDTADFILPSGVDNHTTLSAYVAQLSPSSTKNTIMDKSNHSSTDSLYFYETPLVENGNCSSSIDDSVFVHEMPKSAILEKNNNIHSEDKSPTRKKVITSNGTILPIFDPGLSKYG
ncbi:receptor-type tyrosine-protein phosphatase kappa [Patella vulgata]|uniref:receptor-type tyrosine-protein phosphatase kappa n=1 Tax=Patella vulgata TaxID=6465 RepID=UPI00217FDA26|nr:receptor-type tyrosine-protein phosphatase kappa [Patella vulgata]